MLNICMYFKAIYKYQMYFYYVIIIIIFFFHVQNFLLIKAYNNQFTVTGKKVGFYMLFN